MKIVKFFLHVSKEEQKERFLERINNPEKHWKFAADDVKERGHWDEYMEVYEKRSRPPIPSGLRGTSCRPITSG